MVSVDCLHCGYPIKFDPALGSVIKDCPRCGFEVKIIVQVELQTNRNKPIKEAKE